MGKLRSWRVSALTAVLVACVFTAVGLAWWGACTVYGSNDPGNPKFGLFTQGRAESNPATEGYPYVEAKTDGYGSWASGNAYYCAGGWVGLGWCARATSSAGIVPFGNYSGTARVFVDGVHVGDKHGSTYFDDPIGDDTVPGDCGGEPSCSPIVIPTGQSQAIKLTSPADGVSFDLDADGQLERVAWTAADAEVAFLALDRNGNGLIDSGAELFGDNTIPGAGNGFAALRLTPGHNNDGSIDPADELFASLLLWTDRNHDGVSQADELRPVSDLFDAIGLGYTYAERRDGNGNEYRYRGWARKISRAPKGVPRPGDFALDEAREIKIFDVFLRAQ